MNDALDDDEWKRLSGLHKNFSDENLLWLIFVFGKIVTSFFQIGVINCRIYAQNQIGIRPFFGKVCERASLGRETASAEHQLSRSLGGLCRLGQKDIA